MEDRILFEDGRQKEFLDLVKLRLNSSSLRSLLQFGVNVKYSTLKDYYHERLLLPRNIFEDLCHLSKIELPKLKFEYIESNWGQIKGGKKGIKVIMQKYPDKLNRWRKLGQKNSPIINKKVNKNL